MASHVVVVSSDLRRATVKVTPGTYLIDILEEACKKLGLGSEKYLLKYQKTTLNLSDPFRLTRLSGGSKLELVQKSNTPAVVSVALKLPEADASRVPNGRLTDKFRSDTTLWKLLRHFETMKATTAQALNFTARAVPHTNQDSSTGSGQLYYEQPRLRLAGREISTLADLQKTLSQLGINDGSVLIQLEYHRTETVFEEAMREVQAFFRDEDISSRPPSTTPAAGDGHSTRVGTQLEDEQATSTSSDSAIANTSAPYVATHDPPAGVKSDSAASLAPTGVFTAPTSSMPAAVSTVDAEAVFVPTLAHAQLHQQRLQNSSMNKRLMSDEEIAAQQATDEAKLAAIKLVEVKVRFPDQTSAQWTLDANATGATLYAAVRGVMANASAAFRLVLPGAKGAVENADGNNHRLVRRYHMSGRVLLSLVWEDSVSVAERSQPFLKNSIANQAKALEVPRLPAEMEDAGVHTENVKKQPEVKAGAGEGGSVKMPKWLKLPGKK